MCVKLMKKKKIVSYDQNKPLKSQLRGCTKILFDGKGDSEEMSKFFKEMQSLLGDIDFHKVAQKLSSNLRDAEERIDEISAICLNKET